MIIIIIIHHLILTEHISNQRTDANETEHRYISLSTSTKTVTLGWTVACFISVKADELISRN